MKRCSPEKCMDEIIRNPKSLQVSRLNLTHSSQVISVGGWVGGQCVCIPHLFRSLRKKLKNELSKWFFAVALLFTCIKAETHSELLRVHQLKTNIWLKQGPKTRSKKERMKEKKHPLPEAFLYLFYINNSVFSCLSLFSLPTDILPLWFTLCVL